MTQSEQINELAVALARAQGEFKPASFDKKNPHFNSKYASFTSIVESCRDSLAKHGLMFCQTITEEGEKLSLSTKVIHSSGQWISGLTPLYVDKTTMQGLQSAVTYAKRGGLSALLGIVSDEDDDGNEAEDNPPKQNTTVVQEPKSAPVKCVCGAFMKDSKWNPNELYCSACRAKRTKAA